MIDKRLVHVTARLRWTLFAAATLAALFQVQPAVAAQRAADQGEPRELRRDLERRFDVLILREGLLLRPRTPVAGLNAVEVTRDAISIDGVPVTGAELRDKLGADGDLVIRLSYLDDATRRSIFGQRETAASPPPPPSPPFPQSERRRFRQRRDDRVHIGGSVTVGADETVAGNVVAVGGSARVDGHVEGDVVAIGGGVDLGPNAVVARNVVVIGGVLHRDPGARIDGNIQEIGSFDLSNFRWPGSFAAIWAGSALGAAFSLMATLARVAVLCLLAAIVILVGQEYVERVSARAASEPLKAGAIGFLAQVLFLPLLIVTVLVLVVTIIGIPLLVLVPFVILGLMLVGVVGFTAVGYHVGRLVGARFGWNSGPYALTMTGILVVLAPVILARLIGIVGGLAFPMALLLGVLGTLVEYLAWTVGFGAVALVRFASRTSSA